MQFIDVHCHYDDERFDADRDEVISSLPHKNVLAAIDAGCSLAETKLASKLAEKYSHIFFCSGIYPSYAYEFSPESLKIITSYYAHEKCVGAGEIGLDYHDEANPPRDIQREAFAAQINAAQEAGLPAVIHTREAIGDMLDMIKALKISNGVMHCFSESKETAKICLDAGLYFSFGGTCTFKNAVRAIENLQYIPKDRILLETDSPYLAPVPVRGTRNDSSNIIYIIERIASVWNVTPDEIAQITNDNAHRLFTKL